MICQLYSTTQCSQVVSTLCDGTGMGNRSPLEVHVTTTAIKFYRTVLPKEEGLEKCIISCSFMKGSVIRRWGRCMEPLLSCRKITVQILKFKSKVRPSSVVDNFFEKELLACCLVLIETKCSMTSCNPEAYKIPCYHYDIPTKQCF